MNVQPVREVVIAMVQYSYSHCTSELAWLHLHGPLRLAVVQYSHSHFGVIAIVEWYADEIAVDFQAELGTTYVANTVVFLSAWWMYMQLVYLQLHTARVMLMCTEELHAQNSFNSQHIINFMQSIVPCQYRTAYNTMIQNYCIIIVMTKALIFFRYRFLLYKGLSVSILNAKLWRIEHRRDMIFFSLPQ